MQERYAGFPAPARMGHLASNLLRLSQWVSNQPDDAAITDLMREIACMMEWIPEFATEELADMQREICHWLRIWPVEAARSLLAFRARKMSDRILELSGLQDEPGAKAQEPG
jgi:hypothetical protein